MNIRTAIFWMHLVVGVAVGAVVLIMSVSGALLAFRPQILEVTARNVRHVVPPMDAVRLDMTTLMGAVRAAYPDSKPRAVMVKSDPSASVAVNFGREEGNVYVDPYTGAVLGKESGMTGFMDAVESWHRWLAMEGTLKPIGHNIKGACNIGFLILIVTGLYLWWPRNGTGRTLKAHLQFNPALKGKARDWNWHNVIGFWCAPFLIVISLTGAVMTYAWANNMVYRVTGNEPPVVEREGDATQGMNKPGGNRGGQREKPLDLDLIVRHAQQHMPESNLMNVRLPKPGAPVLVLIEAQGQPYPQRSQLTLDAATGEVVAWEPYAGQNSGRKARTFLRYLHTGEAVGVPGQILAFAASCGAVLLVGTGILLAWRRFFGALRT